MQAPVVPATLATLPAHARVWVYKSAKAFDADLRERILVKGRSFVAGWAAHGAALDAVIDVLHDRFVVVAVDEDQARASGCSIDKSVRFIQDLEQAEGLHLTDRMIVLYEDAEGRIAACKVPEVEQRLKAGSLTADTIVYDDLVGSKADLDARLRVPLRDSWLARFL